MEKKNQKFNKTELVRKHWIFDNQRSDIIHIVSSIKDNPKIMSDANYSGKIKVTGFKHKEEFDVVFQFGVSNIRVFFTKPNSNIAIKSVLVEYGNKQDNIFSKSEL